MTTLEKLGIWLQSNDLRYWKIYAFMNREKGKSIYNTKPTFDSGKSNTPELLESIQKFNEWFEAIADAGSYKIVATQDMNPNAQKYEREFVISIATNNAPEVGISGVEFDRFNELASENKSLAAKIAAIEEKQREEKYNATINRYRAKIKEQMQEIAELKTNIPQIKAAVGGIVQHYIGALVGGGNQQAQTMQQAQVSGEGPSQEQIEQCETQLTKLIEKIGIENTIFALTKIANKPAAQLNQLLAILNSQ